MEWDQSSMVLGRFRVTVLGVLLALSACGQATPRKPSDAGSTAGAASGSAGAGMEGGAPSETGGTSAIGGTLASGGAGTGATGGVDVNGGTAGVGGTAGLGNAAGTGGNAGSGIPELPGANDREREILAPLATDDATVDATSGAELIALARAVGTARGYAMCRCARSPSMPPEDIEDMLDCALEENGFRELTRPDEARCIEEGMATVPGAEEYLRCRVKWIRDDGPAWVSTCTNPDDSRVPGAYCTPSPEAKTFFDECQFSLYCDDGTQIEGIRCDTTLDCSDQSDELACFEIVGRDWFWCDPELVDPRGICRYSTCGLEKTPPVCDPIRPDVYLCDDGGEVSVDLVCDRARNCDDGSDERYCFK
jgi:hypothetical protein